MNNIKVLILIIATVAWAYYWMPLPTVKPVECIDLTVPMPAGPFSGMNETKAPADFINRIQKKRDKKKMCFYIEFNSQRGIKWATNK